MNFVEIQNAVIKNAFDESDRDDVKDWINARGALLWGLDEWSFRRGSALVTVTTSSNVVTGLPADFQIAVDLFRADGYQLQGYEEYREFADIYLGSANASVGPPEAFTILGVDTILVGPASSETSSQYLLAYEKAWTPLVEDDDVPALPLETHLALVYAGKAEGMVLNNILLSDPLEARLQEYIGGMQRDYITALRGQTHQTPAYRPGGALDRGIGRFA